MQKPPLPPVVFINIYPFMLVAIKYSHGMRLSKPVYCESKECPHGFRLKMIGFHARKDISSHFNKKKKKVIDWDVGV